MRDDLVQLLTPQPARGSGVTFRQGVIVSWNQATAENTVLVGDSLLANLTVLNTSEAALLAAGDVVGILVSGSTWGILGRFTVPGSPEAVSALSSLRTASAAVDTVEATSSTPFVDLATYGPEVQIVVGASGRVLVTLSATMEYEAVRGAGLNSAGAMMSFEMSGANTLIAFQTRAVRSRIQYRSAQVPTFDTDLLGILDASKVILLEGLNPGLTNFTCKYAIYGASGPVSFGNRSLTVQAI
jgi:hypothetical protein